jgi:hypothetical protein
MGWRAKLRSQYESFDDFKLYSETYDLHGRLGFYTPEEAWEANPLVQGSVKPSDYRRVP